MVKRVGIALLGGLKTANVTPGYSTHTLKVPKNMRTHVQERCLKMKRPQTRFTKNGWSTSQGKRSRRFISAPSRCGVAPVARTGSDTINSPPSPGRWENRSRMASDQETFLTNTPATIVFSI